MRYSIRLPSLDVNGCNGFFQLIGTVTELLQHFIGQIILDFSPNSVAVHNAQYAQADIGNAILSVHHGRNRQRRAGTVQNAFDDVADGEGHGVEGGSLGLNYHGTGFTNPLFKFSIISVKADSIPVGGMGFVAADVII